ncbi:MAG: hypothetical protein EXS42_00790 [Lacunisphaera sp.]|nr:hypothetical protein [Lacunisphaera sp.]
MKDTQSKISSDVSLPVNPELEQLQQLVVDAQTRLAELEVEYAKEKARVDVVRAALFRRLRERYEKRDRLRLIVGYRQRFLNSLGRGDEGEAKQTEENYEKARRQTGEDYEETTVTMAERRQLTAGEERELAQHWKKLVKMYHPDRFASQPDKLETYQRLTSAINHAKDCGDLKTLKEIAEDPHGFILRQGWVNLDFSDETKLSQLRRINETLQLEIIKLIESLNRLKESPDYELFQLSEQRPGVLDELAAERAEMLDQERVELEIRAGQLAEEIAELSGQKPSRIV